jgi:hypothetical protein
VQRYTIDVLNVNEPPVMNNITYDVVGTAPPGYSWSPGLTAVDPEGDSITFSLPDTSRFILVNGTILQVANVDLDVSQLVVVVVTDSTGLASQGYVTVQVLPSSLSNIAAISVPSRVRTTGGDTVGFNVVSLTSLADPMTAVYTNGIMTVAANCSKLDLTTLNCVTGPVSVAVARKCACTGVGARWCVAAWTPCSGGLAPRTYLDRVLSHVVFVCWGAEWGWVGCMQARHCNRSFKPRSVA